MGVPIAVISAWPGPFRPLARSVLTFRPLFE
jgi:hypothetical protein